jgi:NADPH:quinone reductase-like Zn-dependent oxidoreductase
MKQVWITRVGGPEVLELRDAADPHAGPGQVRIRVAAAGINFADVLARMGLYPDAPKLPAVVGYDVAGTVDEVGSGVTRFATGDRVLGISQFGGYSDCVVVPEGQLSPMPTHLSFEQAAAIPVNYATAWIMLVWLGNVRRGERVLVHAAAGGVGQAAVQICKHRGAIVLGTASASKHDRLRAMGVAHPIDYHSRDFESEVRRLTDGQGVDIALDAVGGKSAAKSYRSLAPLGRLFLFGVSSFAPGRKRSLVAALRGLWQMPKFRPIDLMNENRGVFGVNLGHLWDRQEVLRSIMEEILALVEKRELDPVVDRSFSLADAAKAHEYIQSRQNFGKVVLVP